MIKRSFFMLFFLPAFLSAIAQEAKRKDSGKNNQPTPKIYQAAILVQAKSYGDSVVVRWAPTSAWAWSTLNKTGYVVERIDLTEAKHPQKEIISAGPLKPMTLEQMKANFGRDNKYAAIEAQCLYGKNFASHIRKGAGGQQDKANVWKDRYGFAMQVADFDGQVAKAAALRFTDTKVQKNGIYIYRIYPAQLPGGGKIDTGNVMLENKGRLLQAKPVLKEVIAMDRLAELHWPRNRQNDFSGYFIERSEDGINFKILNAIPYFSGAPDSIMDQKDSIRIKAYLLLKAQQVFIDSLPRNYHPYYYRIRGVDAFADWSAYSDTISAIGKDLAAPSAPIVESPKYKAGSGIVLKWKKPIKEKDFEGYYVTRSHNAVSGPYTSITQAMLDPSITQFTDTGAFVHGQNFYIIAALDTAGNIGSSLPTMGLVPDNTPPVMPKGLKGFISKDGLVHLSWNPNPDEDVKGYKVYFANGSNFTYSQITLTPTSDTVFTDSITLHTLSKDIWYKIVAVDENNNHSVYSVPVRLRKPNIVAPVAPLASKVYVDTGGVKIDWIQSPDKDVVNYIIYRKEKKSDWAIIARVKHDPSQTDFHFTDGRVLPFKEYSYCAEAIDEDSLHSAKSSVINASVKTVPDLPPLKTLSASYDAKSKQVHLSWEYKDNGQYFFVLYKANGNEPLTRFQSEDAHTTQFTDYIPGDNKGNMSYAIQVLFKDSRGRTRVSDPVTVVLVSR